MTDQNFERAIARRELLRRLTLLALVLFASGVALGLLGLSLQIRSTQLEGTPTGRRLLESSDQIISCTTPEGDCYKRSQARTGDAIATLNLGVLYTVLCIDRNPGAEVEQIQSCVQRLYAADAPSVSD